MRSRAEVMEFGSSGSSGHGLDTGYTLGIRTMGVCGWTVFVL